MINKNTKKEHSKDSIRISATKIDLYKKAMKCIKNETGEEAGILILDWFEKNTRNECLTYTFNKTKFDWYEDSTDNTHTYSQRSWDYYKSSKGLDFAKKVAMNLSKITAINNVMCY